MSQGIVEIWSFLLHAVSYGLDCHHLGFVELTSFGGVASRHPLSSGGARSRTYIGTRCSDSGARRPFPLAN